MFRMVRLAGVRKVDFLALRHTFITNLANSGVHPKVAQDFAQHSDSNLTMSRRSRIRRVEALAKLPHLRVGRATAAATGITGHRVEPIHPEANLLGVLLAAFRRKRSNLSD